MTQNLGNRRAESETPQILSPSTDQLVDRKEQLINFTNVLDRIIRQGSVSSNLFEWYGRPGIGKSMLVKMLAGRAREKHAAWAVVNFKQSVEKTDLYLPAPGGRLWVS